MKRDKGMDESSDAVPDPPGSPASAGSRTVFLSYASADAEVANQVCQALEAQGVLCWIAPRDVKPGAQYADAIVRAITDAKALVLVLSASAVASLHVGKEIERASSKRKQVIALKIDAAPLTPALEYFLSESQWIDVPALGMPAALARLAEAVGHGAGAWRADPASGGGLPAVNRAVGTANVAKRVVIAAAVIVVLGIAGTVAVHFWPSKHPEAQQPAVAVISDKSIAVLPFADMSEKKDQEYFADGMAEEILDLLAKIPGLTVIGRTSSFQFKGKNEDLRTIGTKLNAAYVLEGSVRNSGDQVRITAQLINARTGAHEWSETYDRPIGDVLKLQDAIAVAVVRELQLTVAPDHVNSRPNINNSEAYDLYLRGRHAFDRSDNEGLEEAATLFQQALDRDPTSADAAAELANTYFGQVQVGSLAPPIGFELARHAATNALKLDRNNVRAHTVVADIHIIYDWDWAAAERELKQIATVAPGNVDVLTEEAWLSETLGRWDDALKLIKAALAQDPMNPGALQALATIQESRGHLIEAEAAMRRVLDIRPTYGYGHYILGLVLLERGDKDTALLEMQQETIDDGKRQGLAIVYYAMGRTADSEVALAGMLQNDAKGNAFGIAEVYGFRAQTEEAMHWLERAYAQKDAYLYSIHRDSLFKNIEGDSRFKAFLKKMNLPE